ncbi:hypothetical protein [Gottfriedia acidiceleris]|uniref:hypothetical protein n=1 Tax=Gottfriedia acidiceleris TaxID=371036 RepID=UPI003D1D0C3B
MKYISGGYFIVTPKKRPDYMDKDLIPDTILSASKCLTDFYPNISVLWRHSNEAKQKYAQQLNISQSTYEEMEKWVEENFSNKYKAGTLSYYNVFTTIEIAREFLSKFLSHLTDAKIIGIGLPEEYVEEFIEFENNPKEKQYGIEQLLLHRITIEESDSKLLGYEVIGFEGVEFHSYLCSGLEKDYKNLFGFTLNENGFISTLEEATLFCDYTNDEELGEPVLYLPWGIFEYKIK